VVQIWSRNTLQLRGGETLAIHRVEGPPLDLRTYQRVEARFWPWVSDKKSVEHFKLFLLRSEAALIFVAACRDFVLLFGCGLRVEGGA
jgi:hypothetical protein